MLAGIDLSKMCRVCRDEPDCLLDLFVDSPSPNREPSLAVMLSKCTGCEVDRADRFPHFICAECAADTRRAFRLRRQCRRSMQYFNQMRVIMVELNDIEAYGKLEDEVIKAKRGELGLSREVSNAMLQADGEASQEDAAMMESLFVELVAPTQSNTPESPENSNKKPCDKEPLESMSRDSSSHEEKTLEKQETDGEASQEDAAMMESLFVELVAPNQSKAPESPENSDNKKPCDKEPLKFISRDSSLHKKKTLKTAGVKESSSASTSEDSSSDEENTRAVKRSHSGSSSDENWTPAIRKKAKKIKDKCFKCRHCDASFDKKNSLVLHERVHTGIRPYQCCHCPRSFTQKGNLQTHIRIHTGERPFKCTHCDLTFRQVAHIRVHELVHTGEKPFKCSYCSEAFKQKVNLQKHTVLHTGKMLEPRKRTGPNKT